VRFLSNDTIPSSNRYVIPDGVKRYEEPQAQHDKMAFDCPADRTYNPYDASFIKNDRRERVAHHGDTGETDKGWYGFRGREVNFGTVIEFPIPMET
jgi:hypothetical protein